MVKLISTENSIMFLDPKVYRHENTTELELHKNSQNFLRKETIYRN